MDGLSFINLLAHLYGLSPLWVLMWVVTELDWENFRLQMEHLSRAFDRVKVRLVNYNQFLSCCSPEWFLPAVSSAVCGQVGCLAE